MLKIQASYFLPLAQTIKRLALLASCLMAVSCGWQLRGFNQGKLPSHIALKTGDPYAAFARQLQQTLVRRGITVRANAALQLEYGAEALTKRTVAVTRIGASAQYELQLSIEYHYKNQTNQNTSAPSSANTPLPLEAKTLSTQRVFDFVPGSNLAKSEEEQTLIAEMRQELINRILATGPKAHTKTLNSLGLQQPATFESKQQAADAQSIPIEPLD